MKHQLLDMWLVLWQQMGVRPIDVETMTLDDVLVVMRFAETVRSQLALRR